MRARATRLAGSVRERAIAPSLAKSSPSIANSTARRRAAMPPILFSKITERGYKRLNNHAESSRNGRIHGIDVLGRRNEDQASCGSLPAGPNAADVQVTASLWEPRHDQE
jgi:hypothetical protein